MIAICGFLTACKQPMENPETADPIYQDLEGRAKAAEAEAETEKKSLLDLQKTLAGLPAHDPLKGQVTRTLQAEEKKITALGQESLYYQIRAEQRRTRDQSEYSRRFAADLPWPDVQEARNYNEVKKLQGASRNWNDRVPKPKHPGAPGGAEAKAKPKEGGHEE